MPMFSYTILEYDNWIIIYASKPIGDISTGD